MRRKKDRKANQPIDMGLVKTTTLASRKHKVHIRDFAKVGQKGMLFSKFIENLPNQLAAKDLRAVVGAIISAREHDKPVIWGLGAHVIKCGLSTIIIDLMERDLVTAVALNGAGSIHDVEIALVGSTSEDVPEKLEDATFGMAEETAKLISEALGSSDHIGMGELVGKRLTDIQAPNLAHSILANGVELGVPVTVHVAIGTDTIHMHPGISGEAIGRASLQDFRLLAGIVANLGHGGVYLNVGSAVVLPEVFLKAMNLARNAGYDVSDFVTVNLDMYQHYRPLQNVVRRPTARDGRGYAFTGHHELMIPLLAQSLIEQL